MNNKARVKKNSYQIVQSEYERRLRPRSLIRIPEEFENVGRKTQRLELNHTVSEEVEGFHITDLLNTTNKVDEIKAMKRQRDQEILAQQDKEYVIKNYRLIQKKKRDLYYPNQQV